MSEIKSESFEELLKEEEEPQVPETDLEVITAPVDSISEALETSLSTLAPSAVEKQILECFLRGYTIDQIVIKVGIQGSYIRTYLRNPKVREYIQEVKEAVNELDQMMLSDTLRKAVQARVEKAVSEDGEVDYALISNKDTLDIIKVFADMTNNISKNKREEKSDNVFVNIYNQILD